MRTSAVLPRQVRVVEVGPRDGLQNQPVILPASSKAEWIERLIAAGLPEIEVTSFVHPKWVPQLADGAEVIRRLPAASGTLYSALVPNLKGLERALASGLKRIAVFTAASETFCRKNINCSIDESIERFRRIFERIGSQQVHVRGYISTCFGCPYEGAVDPGRVLEIAVRLHDLGCAEIAISDTIGVATPPAVTTVVERVQDAIPLPEVALHFHDTRGLALVNVLTGLELGVTTYDSSAGGLGGCPYAPGASGNLATEDLIYFLDSLGVETGVDLEKLVAADLWFERSFPTPFPSRVLATHRSHV